MMARLFLIFVIILWSLDHASGQACPGLLASEFKTQCANQFHGDVDGSSCFYVLEVDKDWTNANAGCNKDGSVLAQIHTDSELKIISNYLRGKYGAGYNQKGYLWIGLQRDQNVATTETCSFTHNTTFWYDNGVKNPSLSVGNTWMREQVCYHDQGECVNCNCFALVNYKSQSSGPYSDFTAFAPYSCSQPMYPLCQYKSNSKNYTLVTDTACLAEMPIMTFPTSTPEHCAYECTRQTWCQSFNFGMYNSDLTNNTCQLFSWSVNDTCAATCQKTLDLANPAPFWECDRFNYVS